MSSVNRVNPEHSEEESLIYKCLDNIVYRLENDIYNHKPGIFKPDNIETGIVDYAEQKNVLPEDENKNSGFRSYFIETGLGSAYFSLRPVKSDDHLWIRADHIRDSELGESDERIWNVSMDILGHETCEWGDYRGIDDIRRFGIDINDFIDMEF